jgi:electron transfer flavoprotein alpha subunit
MKKILMYLDGNHPNDLSLIGACELMVEDEYYEITAVGTQNNVSNVDGLYDQVLIIDNCKIKEYDTMNLAELLKEVHNQHHYDIILFSATQIGRILAPRLAIALNTGLVADVTDIKVNNGEIEMIRPAYSGKLMAQIVSTGNGPIMMSIRPGVFKPNHLQVRQTVKTFFDKYQPKQLGVRLIETKAKTNVEDIRDSKVLISGGAGILEHFNRLQDLASVLNAQVSASRKIVDAGIVKRKIQVGQSGKSVSPKLYIALGISGSVQHIEGLKNVETIIAVNTDKHAPICSLAQIVVEGDALDFVDRLLYKIEKSSLNF